MRSFTKQFTDVDMYKQDVPEAPEGYRITDFRVPKINEMYIAPGCKDYIYKAMSGVWTDGMPRLILEKIPVKVITFRSIGYRKPLFGEYYLDVDGTVRKATKNFYSIECELFTRTETTE